MTSFPRTLADLEHHLPNINSSLSLYNTIDALRKATLSIPNRLKSVLQDAEFVESLQNNLNRHHVLQHDLPTDLNGHVHNQIWPLIPNERSGSWPLDPDLKLQSQRAYLSSTSPHAPSATIEHVQRPVSAYFKSTDGHISQWAFSTRRLNLPVLYLLGFCSTSSGAVLVDTTRRGKAYPDALRRTVPIWCTVWNRVLFPELIDTGICDFQPFELDQSESSQIIARIPGFMKDLQDLNLDLESIRARVKHPVRCVWAAQPCHREQWANTFIQIAQSISGERAKWDEVHANILVCCSASKRVIGTEMSEDGYIQGAGDDSEGWSYGLSAGLFWECKEQLLQAVDSGQELEDLVKTLVTESKVAKKDSESCLIKPAANLYLTSGFGDIPKDTWNTFDLLVDCSTTSTANETGPSSTLLGLACKEGKLGSKMLREKLPDVKQIVGNVLKKNSNAEILVRCSTGKDLSVGVVLVILCCFYADNGSVNTPEQSVSIDKLFIKQRLAWITSSKPDANPSRATLQAVNSFLIGRPD